jgi:uncharacterized protein YbjT (DUF2867 family)
LARGLIVGCGCRGRELGRRLAAEGWQVRGTSRHDAGLDAIAAASIEAVRADPDRIGTLVDQLEGVTLIFWLLGSARGGDADVAALHGPRLERLLGEIVDTPVRGVVYEHTGGLPPDVVTGAIEVLRAAGERWRIPFEVVDVRDDELDTWCEGMLAAARGLVGG